MIVLKTKMRKISVKKIEAAVLLFSKIPFGPITFFNRYQMFYEPISDWSLFFYIFVDPFLYLFVFAPLQKNNLLMTLCIRSHLTGNESSVTRNSQSLMDIQITSFLIFQIFEP